MGTQLNPIPIYTSSGEARAFLIYPYLFNPQGEWIGWVTQNREVFSVLGMYIGYLSNDPRILRKRSVEMTPPRRTPPARPDRAILPATIPLAPLLREIGYDLVDVLEESPEELHTFDTGDLKEDLE